LLAAAVHCLVGLDAFLIIEFAIAIGVKLGYDLRRVSRSFLCSVLRMHAVAEVLSLGWGQDVDKVTEVLFGGAATLRNEFGLALHQFGELFAIGRFGVELFCNLLANLMKFLSNQGRLSPELSAEFAKSAGLPRVEVKFLCSLGDLCELPARGSMSEGANHEEDIEDERQREERNNETKLGHFPSSR
jgi:hypothetical protein